MGVERSWDLLGPGHIPNRAHDTLLEAREAHSDRDTMIAALWFSRWFIVTYQAVMIGLLAFFSLCHFYVKMRRRRQCARQKLEAERRGECKVHGPGRGGPCFSPSTGIQDNEDASTLNRPEYICEHAPLLSEEFSGHRRSLQWLPSAVHAAAMHQPRPLPILNKVLPTNSTILVISLLIGINIFYLLYKDPNPFNINLTFSLGNRAGLMFVANLPWLYLLGAKNQPIKFLTGLSYENLNILHRRQGEWMSLLAILHVVGMLCSWYVYLLPTGMTFWAYLQYKIIILGVAAFACYGTIYATSLASFRQWWYELFLATHIVVQATALPLVFFHHFIARPYIAISLAIFVVDRLLFRMLLKTRSFRARLTVLEDGRTLLVSADWPLDLNISGARKLCKGLGIVHGWRPTEHVFLSVPCLSSKHVVQAHPFTIGSAAPAKDQQHAWFDLIVRVRDGFTKDLLEHARTHSSAVIRVDGPYGSLDTLEMLEASDHAVLVAGGSGIAVAYPLLWTLLNASGRDLENGRRKHVHLIWVVQDASHISWIGQGRLDELRDKGLRLCLPAPTSKAGRPDVAGLVRDAVDECCSAWSGKCVGVMVSGPDGMNRTVQNACADLVWHGRDVDVAVEKFGW